MSNMTPCQLLNSLWSSDGICRPENVPSLVRIMACGRFGRKLLLNQCWLIIKLILTNKFQRNLNQNTKRSSQEIHSNISSAKWRSSCSGFNCSSVDFSRPMLIESTRLPLDKMAAISQTIFSDAFSWMKSFAFSLRFQRSLFLTVQFTIT